MLIKSCRTCTKAKRCNKKDVARDMPCIAYKEVGKNVETDNPPKPRS